MTLGLWDWLVVALPVLIVVAVALYTRRYVKGVSDFLAGGRSAGRYLICNAEGAAAMGAITIVAVFEQIYQGGPGVAFWAAISGPVWLMVSLTGFIIYRYRETRALTMAEFFEMRYSRRFRVFMGVVAFLAGIINYGIFPAVGARFIMYFCGLPEKVGLGVVEAPTMAVVMAVIMSLNLAFANLGGQLTAMVTDCIEGIISGVFFLIVATCVISIVGLERVRESISNRPAGQSFLDPFDTFGLQDFNLWFVLIGLFISVYSYMAWQGNQGFNASALNPHEARMGRILGQWRGYSRGVMIIILALGAYAFLNHPDFAAAAAGAHHRIDGIPGGETLQKQLTVPVALGELLPVGVKGMLLAIIIFAMMAADTSYMHSWGSIFIQDVVLPFRRRPISPTAHIRLLRWSIAGVALFAFCFSLFFRQTEYIFMYFAITGAIYLGGAGAVIIGGLYWSRGTEAGAWSAMVVGSSLAVGAIVLRQLDPGFPLNGQVLGLIATLVAIGTYVGVSLATCVAPHNMEKLLHRGQYAAAADQPDVPTAPKPPRTWQAFIGIDDKFTRGDRIQSIALFAWSMFWFGLFGTVVVWNLLSRWPLDWWWNYTVIVIFAVPMFTGLITTVWFGIGGVRDLRRLIRRLSTMKRDAADSGVVLTDSPADPPH